ncbi:MAG: DUF3794 domain-containing protein [Clostridia bacterium]|nr:DUF3794 domain-containing protein [Clostridia bacterium]
MEDSQKVRLDLRISENSGRMVVRGRVGIPEPKPAAEKILSTEKTVWIREVRLLPNKAVAEGVLHLHSIYTAFSEEQSVHHFHGQVPFTLFIDLPGALPGMTVKAEITAEETEFIRAADAACAFEVTAILLFSAVVTEVQEVEVLTACPDGCQCETELLEVDLVAAQGSRQILLEQKLPFPPDCPPVERVLDSDARLEVRSIRVLTDQVLVEGQAHLQMLYVALLPEQPVHRLNVSFSFSDFVEVPGARDWMKVRHYLYLEHLDLDPCSCDQLTASLVIKLSAYGVQRQKLQLLTDIAGCSYLPQLVQLRVDSLVGEGSSQIILKDSFCTPDPRPPVEKILDSRLSQIQITSQKIIPGKIIVKGQVSIALIYAALGCEQAVHTLERQMSFHAFVEMEEAEEGLRVEILPESEYITARPENCCIQIETVLKFSARAYRTLERSVISCLLPWEEEETPQEEEQLCQPGQYLTHIVQAGDSLYSIGLPYGASVEDMIAANPQLSNPDQLEVGMSLNIPCIAKG